MLHYITREVLKTINLSSDQIEIYKNQEIVSVELPKFIPGSITIFSINLVALLTEDSDDECNPPKYISLDENFFENRRIIISSNEQEPSDSVLEFLEFNSDDFNSVDVHIKHGYHKAYEIKLEAKNKDTFFNGTKQYLKKHGLFGFGNRPKAYAS